MANEGTLKKFIADLSAELKRTTNHNRVATCPQRLPRLYYS